jgi:hypothetical protein
MAAVGGMALSMNINIAFSGLSLGDEREEIDSKARQKNEVSDLDSLADDVDKLANGHIVLNQEPR